MPRSVAVGLLLLLALLTPPRAPAVAPPQDPAAPALAVLRRHCAACHGAADRAKGGFGQVLDPAALVARGYVVPGRAARSPLFHTLEAGEMPPPARSPRPTADDIAAVRRWIDAGAPAPWAASETLPGPAELAARVRDDLLALPPRERRFARYLSLRSLPPAQRTVTTQAVARLVNSLSWHPRLSAPAAVGPALLRLDLRHYRWNARLWDRLALKNPYRESLPEDVVRLTGTDQPLLRADWFVATAARPPSYHDFLALPATDRALERLLGVEVRDNIDNDDVARAGFNDSGVARNNRLLERHPAPHGAYWRSYDFSDNTGVQNLFDRPLGPAPGPRGFRHAGGEVIFHLPNGLFGFLLMDADGGRVDRAPGEIVSDPKRPDRLVETGLSCIGCHNAGLIPKADQVRPHVQKNAKAFGPAAEQALALYPPRERFRALVEGDNERFLAALRALGITPGEPEPVTAVTLRYEAVLDLPTAAAEVGVNPATLVARLESGGDPLRLLRPLRAPGGTVSRQVFEEAYPVLAPASALNFGPAAAAGGRLPGVAQALVVSPNGQVLAVAAEAGGVWLLEVGTLNVRATLPARRDDVAALAFAPDGRFLAAGGRDRAVRVWDVATGKLLRTLTGSTEPVRALAWLPDGGLLTAGEDRAIRRWDRAGREAAAWTAHAGPVTALAVSADGRAALTGGTDRLVKVWDLATGRERAAWAGHSGAVLALALSPDGKLAASAGGDRTLRLWDVASGRPTHRLDRDTAASSVAFGPAGRVAFVEGEAAWVWTPAGPEPRRGAAPVPGAVGETLAFGPGGRAVWAASGRELRRSVVP